MPTILLTSQSPAATQRIARAVARDLPPGSVIALFGGLGSGKTVFAQAFGRALGVTTAVRSPTYVIVSQHRLPRRKITRLYHADLFRLRRLSHDDAAILLEAFNDKRGATIVEWADRARQLLPKNATLIAFSVRGPRIRALRISARRLAASTLARLARRLW